MKKIKFLSAVMAFIAGTALLSAGSREEYIIQLMKSQPSAPKATIQNGRMVGFFVVGVAPIPRSMTKSRAKAYARKAARRDAEKKVSQFFNSSVRMSETENGETIMTVAGEASGDKGPAASKESSAEINRTSETFQKVSSSAQSGLEGEGFQIIDGEMVEVFSWSAAKSRALRGAIRNMGRTADVGVKTANKVEQSRATGATEEPAPAPAPAVESPAQQQTLGAGLNTPPVDTTNVAPAAPSADFF